jgi:hypothetical protein
MWAEKRTKDRDQRFEAARKIADNIPLGQPILIGHHSERHARADARRIDNNMRAGCESHKMAERHLSRAHGIEIALERTIFSDDDDAVQKLEEKAKKYEAEAERAAAINRAWRKGAGRPGWADGLGLSQGYVATIENLMEREGRWLKSPCSTTSARAKARTARQRIAAIRSAGRDE